jgi:hypothetical protein
MRSHIYMTSRLAAALVTTTDQPEAAVKWRQVCLLARAGYGRRSRTSPAAPWKVLSDAGRLPNVLAAARNSEV